MKILIRISLGLIALVVVACLAIVLLLPRLIDTPEFRRAVGDLSRDSIGRPLEYDSLSVGLFPLSVVVEGARIAGHAPDEEHLLATDAISLHVGLLPLFRGEVHVASLVIEGASVNLVQTDEGLMLPTPPEPEEQAEAAEQGASPIALAIREVALRGAKLSFEDRSVSPLVRHEIDGLEVRARGSGTNAPIQIEASATPRASASAGMTLGGTIDFTATLAPDLSAPSGEFELDLTPFDLDVDGSFKKPKGMPAGVVGSFGVEPSGDVRVHIGRLALRNFEASGRVDLAEQTRVLLSAEPFELEGWGEVLPALEPYSPGGRIGLADFSLVPEPFAVGGRIELQEVTLHIPDADVLTIRGAIAGKGDGVRLHNFSLEAGGQRVSLTGGARDLMGDVRFDVGVASEGVLRANPLVSALADVRDTLHGPLEIDGRLAGRAGATGSETALTDSLSGHLSVHVGRGAGDGSEGGRLEGVSLLKSALGGLEQAGMLAMKIASRETGVQLAQYTGDAFERMDARFEIGGGRLDTRDLRIIYRGYGVNLRGSVGMVEQDLDMTGELELEKEVARLLGAEPSGDRLVVPLAQVGGTIEAPVVALSEDAAKAILADNVQVKKAKKELGGLIRRSISDAFSGGDQQKQEEKGESQK
jgi:hypothetical protein